MRKEIVINSGWHFTKEKQNCVPECISATGWERVELPHTWNRYDGQDGGADYYRGECWYYKEVDFPFIDTNKCYYLDFGGVSSQCRVFFNGDSKGGFAAVIIEGIQGVAGIYEPTCDFLNGLRTLCDKYGCLLILDEIQSGYGRTGKFFAHQHHGVRADIITMAKGMANGFPIGGVLISPSIKPAHGMLGTTFGGNHLACTAALAVLDIIEKENLIENAAKIGEYFEQAFKDDKAIKEYRGKGLMIGLELKEEYVGLRNRLLFERHFFTGAAGAGVIRLLPSLTISQETAESFVAAWRELTK